MQRALPFLMLCLVGCVEQPDSADFVTVPVPDIPVPDRLDPNPPRNCRASEPIPVGPSMDWPAIAGTDTGFALVYREASLSQWITALTFDRSGDAAASIWMLLGSNFRPQVTSDDDEYVVHAGGNFYWFGQDGAIDASALNAQWPGMAIDQTESGLRGVTAVGGPDCPNLPRSRWAIVDVDHDGHNGIPVVGPCVDNNGWWPTSFAAHDDSAVMATEAMTLETDEAVWYELRITVFHEGHHRFTLANGYYDYAAVAWESPSVWRTITTDDGYAILWYVDSVQPGQSVEQRSFLTFLAHDGEFLGTREIEPYTYDIAWNGEAFGLVRDGDISPVRSMVIERREADGELISALNIPTGVDYNNTPRIAASGEDFAIAYGTGGGSTPFELSYLTVDCP